MEACPRCEVIYAKYGALVVPEVRRPVPRPSAAVADRFARNRRSLLTHGAVGLLALLVGFYAGQMYLQMKIVAAVSDAFGGAAKALARESPAPVRPAPPESKVIAEESPLSVTLVKKGFRDQEFSGSRVVTDAITFAVDFSNSGSKDIRAFDGALVFTDLLDNEILGARVSISDPVAAGATIRWDGELEFNQFMDRHRRLRDQAAGDLRVAFKPGRFLYADGTRSDQ